MRRLLALALAAAVVGYLAFGAVAWQRRGLREAQASPALAAAEARGAWHVHTTASDGRGTLDEVARAARAAGLRFVVVSDHDVLAPAEPRYQDGVLLVPATEASTRQGHVVALGVSRALTRAERDGDALAAIRALGGQAVIAHPLHPRRAFTGWGGGAWRGLEVISNDTAWYRALADRDLRRVLEALAVLPWDPPRAVLALLDDPADELRRLDGELRRARAAAGAGPAPAHVLLCSADAHGYPGYAAAFGAFSMHVPVTLGGDAARDAAAVRAALLDGRAACVLDGLAPAAGVRLTPTAEGALSLSLHGAAAGSRTYTLLHDGAPAGRFEAARDGSAGGTFRCGGRCPPGDYRAEVALDGRRWIFTNPVRIE
ncbi:PHP domain-containing protein [Anaeromyxobacter sp. PSR-1]|uniref:PHP domain-containing protein n=1 Tax=Anaeromyxobacter sp. PSR-1 TaxID=1300915 RepID=UPI0005E205A0|nr:phosphoesterase [Anaeromyxobacter sp. PSR-1]GAO02374.1 PHP domain protein [Anaeromyxobacter sp. PSR-1]